MAENVNMAGALLRQLRIERRITMGECAKYLGIKVTEYSDMEAGRRNIYSKQLGKLNRLFRLVLWMVGQFKGPQALGVSGDF